MRSHWSNSQYDDGWALRPTRVVRWLLIANLAVFVIQIVSGWLGSALFQRVFELYAPAIRQGWIWQFFTYMFLHGGALHLIVNLLALYFFGNEVEASIGSKRTFQLYALGGMVGGLLWYAFNFGHAAAVVGASGAVYAVVVAFATLYPDRPITLLIFFVLPVTFRAKYLAIGVIVTSVLFSMDGVNGNIAHLAHLGGAAMGYFFIQFLTHKKSWFPIKQNRPPHLRVLPAPARKEEFIQQRIDPILDKIAEHGIQSLTSKERRLLDEAKDRLS